MNKKADKQIDQAFIERFSEIIKDIGGEAVLAEKSSVSRPSIDKYKKGLSDPSRLYLVQLAKAAGVSVEWLATGEGAKKLDDQGPFLAIPVLPTAGSAGGGLAVEYSEIGAAYPLPRVWAQRQNLKETNAFAIWGVEGMEPTCSSNDILIGTTATLGMHQNGVFIIKEGELFNVRRLQWKGDRILVKSDNGLYEDDALPLDTDAIVARVMYVTRIDRFNDAPKAHSNPV